MRRITILNSGWLFIGPDGVEIPVNIPHTWNAQDGCTGGNSYYRGICEYRRTFARPDYHEDDERVYIEFCGVNSSALVVINEKAACRHDGGYSTFRVDITNLLKEQNNLKVSVDNGANQRVYPQMADFTFYGGIYRDVKLLIVSKDHFDLDYYGSTGIKVTPEALDGVGRIRVETFPECMDAEVKITLKNQEGVVVAKGSGIDITLEISNVHLWTGVKDPYLYTAVAQLVRDGIVLDEVQSRFGVRTFRIDPKKGFFLNDKPYALRGVSRHQDWKGLGSAISKEHLQKDMDIIKEMSANSIRLAHYQHDQYFYDLCDECGMIVWAEIPYISSHMPEARENTVSQMKELIVQNYNHPCIITWGLSNEITISTKNKRDMLKNHYELNDLCHDMDKTRPTTLACYSMCSMLNKTVHISDVVGYNLYLGWYVPGLFLNDLFMSIFHRLCPERSLCYSEYGCEGMPNLHSSKPRRGDHSEEFQATYHEYMLRCFDRHPYLWAAFLWNMFDFGSDARDQGGEPGMNHKGLVTYDRKIKKDSFYVYKAYWSEEPFVHICGSRYIDRPEKRTTVKVYSNQPKIALYNNGRLVAENEGHYVFTFKIFLDAENHLEAVGGEYRDSTFIRRTKSTNNFYRLKKSSSKNWVQHSTDI